MKEPRSHCCLAKRKEVSGHEGTGYYVCWACGKEFISEEDAVFKPIQGDLSPDGKEDELNLDSNVAWKVILKHLTPETRIFIEYDINKRLAEARRRTLANVGLLRQWLNEDRITDPTKTVTNEDLIHWLSL